MSAEQLVLESLGDRPAGIIASAPINVRNCFAGMFNGCKATGSIGLNDHLFIGKAECEWDWRETWGDLKTRGLIDWREETIDAPGAVGGKMTKVHLRITDKGWDVREDDVKWFRELMSARDEDEKNAP